MIKRKLEPIILEMLDNFRIVAINGPRQSGKTTLAKLIVKNKNIIYYTFDDEDVYNTAKLDPNGFISYISKDNVVIDEVQMIPELIPSIKMQVDEVNKKGMFLLTGSSDMFKNSKIKESLAGRMVSFNLYPLSYSEINNRDTNIIDKLFSDDFNYFDIDFTTISNQHFTEAVINGGYPEIYTLSTKAKYAWYESYIKSRITKDIQSIGDVDINQIVSLAKLLQLLAGQISSLVNYKNIADKIKISDKTVRKYIEILEALYIIKLVPAYANNQLKRVVKSPKVHFIDSGLASYFLNVDADGAMVKQGELYGDIVESFVYSELLKHKSTAQRRVNIYHFRDQQKKEVDFVLESTDSKIVAIEVKSGSNIKKEYFKGLVALADTIKGKDFKGIILYGGNKVIPYKIQEYQFWVIPLKIFL
ncbi:ATP-binding protein [Sulfurimonas sp. SAG-AH-194-C20]|nr:ATP-binding protein [Sulfurimonas sp. SAG-AH-194-C20]MDF1878440.1 ATP-binding protein [Sulfurimonas sp. SAG-AH-194-C20]